MKKMLEDLFINNLPTLDLHGFDRDSARIALNDFINDSYKLGLKKFVVIHGVGTLVIKNEVHKTLKNNKLVVNFKLHYFNNGCTIVNLQYNCQ